MKILLVGDLHVKKDNIEESDRILRWVFESAKKSSPDMVLFLGDQYNDMGIARVEIMEFWHKWLGTFSDNGIKVWSIVGNHDMNSDGSANAMTVHENLCTVVGGEGKLITTGECFIGFIRSNEAFVSTVQEFYAKGAKYIFCHAEFNGAKYENGFYAPHGIDTSLLPSDIKFVSGHIHMAQEFANVWYPGTPRQLTRSDVGEQKGIWLIDTKEASRQFLPTPDDVSEKFSVICLKEGDEIPEVQTSSRTYVDVYGSLDYIKLVASKMPEGVRLRSFPDSEKRDVEIKESDGIPVAFIKYAQKYFEDFNVPKTDQELILSKVKSLCPSLFGGSSVSGS